MWKPLLCFSPQKGEKKLEAKSSITSNPGSNQPIQTQCLGSPFLSGMAASHVINLPKAPQGSNEKKKTDDKNHEILIFLQVPGSLILSWLMK